MCRACGVCGRACVYNVNVSDIETSAVIIITRLHQLCLTYIIEITTRTLSKLTPAHSDADTTQAQHKEQQALTWMSAACEQLGPTKLLNTQNKHNLIFIMQTVNNLSNMIQSTSRVCQQGGLYTSGLLTD